MSSNSRLIASFRSPLLMGSLLLVAACTAAATSPEQKATTNAAIEGSEGGGGGGGGADTGLRCDATNIAMPADLPDIENCINDRDDGTGPGTTCNGWSKVGSYLRESDELRSLGELGAQAYMIEPDANTLCLYLYRGDRAVSGGSFNGVHCYNKTTCDVCWWDAATARGVKPRAADLRHASDDNCSDCHRNGPLLPKATLWGALESTTKRLHQICAAAGGPTWRQAPEEWTFKTPDRTTIVRQPAGCGGNSCHSSGFASGGSYCTLVKHAFEDGTGSMRSEGKVFGSKTACEQFRTDMGCAAGDLDCDNTDVATADVAPVPETPAETPAETPPDDGNGGEDSPPDGE